ncbi:MAG TPA: tetratricopeptide repeat protein, partial [Candidatus Saccharimonadales bacterium]|nr:tetratricopeptide repeat protein [Candidatus Saccharimonadales bacterium]
PAPRPRRRPLAIGLSVLAAAIAVGALAVPWFRQASAGRTPSDIRAWYERGTHYMEEHQTEAEVNEAIRLFTRAVGKEPGFAEAQAALGNAWWERYRLTHKNLYKEEAQRAVEAALKLSPDLPLAHNAAGYGLLVEGDADRARDEFLEATRGDASLASAWANLGQACARLGRYDEGLEAIRTAIRLRPDKFRYQVSLGVFFERFSEYKSARNAYRKAIDLKPDSWIAWSNLGAVDLRSGNFEAAVPSLLRAAEIEETADVHSNLGTAYYYLGKLPEAVEHYRRAVELDPGKSVAWANLGDALREVGNDSEARDAYSKAIPLARAAAEKEPALPVPHARLGLYCARAGESECALAEASRLEELDGATADTYLNAAVIYCVAGRREAAFGALEKAARLGIARARIEKDPDLSSLAGDPRFERILALAG